jgi:2-polyprenyl-6-methoxyphenol hydroxylase-like FAD-dependent oxidoreductase
MDVISQIRMPSIVKGRIALVGDAAHCPTFMSGMGASLALQGARLLAQNLATHGSVPSAFASYERAITPIAERYQKSALRMKTVLLDRRPWIAKLRNFGLRFTPSSLMNQQMRNFFRSEMRARKWSIDP